MIVGYRLFPLLMIALAVVALWAILGSSRRRQSRAEGDAQACTRCGSSNPLYAIYCRQCGGRLP